MEKLNHEEKQLLNYIPYGAERPRPLKELVSLTGWSSRQVRKMVNHLIMVHRLPIGAMYDAPHNGYFIISNVEEKEKALAPLQSQYLTLKSRLNVIEGITLKDNKKPVSVE